MAFAVIEAGGKQYKVSPGDKIKIEKIEAKPGVPFSFNRVLLVAENDSVQVGTPYLPGTVVEGTVLREGRADKIIVFKYHSKTRYKKKKGHRQPFTEVGIVRIR